MSSVVVHVMVRNILQRLMMSLLTFIKVLYPNGEFPRHHVIYLLIPPQSPSLLLASDEEPKYMVSQVQFFDRYRD